MLECSMVWVLKLLPLMPFFTPHMISLLHQITVRLGIFASNVALHRAFHML